MVNYRLYVFLISLAIFGCESDEQENVKLNLDLTNITVSGISSGGYMAHQFHIAYSEQVVGAALMASGPYGCSEGSLQTALTNCLNNSNHLKTEQYLSALKNLEKNNDIASLDKLNGDKVWIYRGLKDNTISQNVVQSQAGLYRWLGAQVLEVYNIPSGHGLPSNDFGVNCELTASPFINNCELDGIGAFFNYLYTEGNSSSVLDSHIKERPNIVTASLTGGEFISFKQAEYLSESESNTLAELGYLYIPKNCLKENQCRVHIAFHGCQQNQEKVGMDFIQNTSYSQCAQIHNIVVMYPQTTASLVPLNPKACWDWWGYTGKQFQTRSGKQIKHIYQMLLGISQYK